MNDVWYDMRFTLDWDTVGVAWSIRRLAIPGRSSNSSSHLTTLQDLSLHTSWFWYTSGLYQLPCRPLSLLERKPQVKSLTTQHSFELMAEGSVCGLGGTGSDLHLVLHPLKEVVEETWLTSERIATCRRVDKCTWLSHVILTWVLGFVAVDKTTVI